MDGLFRDLLARARHVLRECSLQQLGDLARAFHTTDLPPAQLADFDEALRGAIGAWLTHPSHQHNTVYLSWPPTYRASQTSHSVPAKLEKPTVTRQIVNEAANTLSRFVQVGVLQPESGQAVALLELVGEGVNQVRSSLLNQRIGGTRRLLRRARCTPDALRSA